VSNLNSDPEYSPLEFKAVHRIFEEASENFGDASALLSGDVPISYADLNRRANLLAQAILRRLNLEERGDASERPVGLCVGRSANMLVGILAILKAGCAYVPLEPAHPRERLNYIAHDTGLNLVLVETGTRNVLEAFEDRLLDIDEERGSGADSRNPSIAVGPGHLAYVIYTSGSTGKPKGVMIEHEGLPALAAVAGDLYGITALDRILQIAPLGFDVAVEEWVFALTNGATLVLEADKERLIGRELAETCNRHGITFVTLSPGLLDTVPLDIDIPSLKTVVIGGESGNSRLIEEWRGRVALYNAYGPTEATVDATVHKFEDVPNPQVIGTAVAGKNVYVLDEHLAPCPIGVPGQIHVGGVGIARGYVNLPELTAHRFVTSRAHADGVVSERLYSTGDVGKRNANGAIEFLGRIDRQTKIRGQRVEIDEIEMQLKLHPSVKDAVVVARRGADSADAVLVAFVIRRDEDSVDASDEWRTYLGTYLPEYMLPNRFVALPEFPLNANGKIDRAELERQAGALKSPYGGTAARTALERRLHDIWAAVLKHRDFGVLDDFTSCGGNSLLACRIVSAVRAALGTPLKIADLYQNANIAHLADWVKQNGGTGVDDGLVISKREACSMLPLSFAQERLWFMEQFENRESAAYNIADVFRIRGKLDRTALRASLNALAKRHPGLRTVFKMVDGVPYQSILDDVDIELELLECPSTVVAPAGDLSPAVRNLVASRAVRPFDLESGPLLRAALISSTGDEHVLLILQHHIISDGWSIGVLCNELAKIYGGVLSGTPADLPELPLAYTDFSASQRDWLQGGVLKQQLDFWRAALGDYQELSFPLEQPRPGKQDFLGDHVEFEVPASMAGALSAAAKERRTSLFAVLFGAFNLLIGRYSNQKDLVIGVPVANRHYANIENIVGFFVNTLPVRTKIDPESSWHAYLDGVTRNTFDAFQHQDLPFGMIVDALNVERDASKHPIFQILFVMQNAASWAEQTPRLAGADVEKINFRPDRSKFDLTLDITEENGALKCAFEFNKGLLTPKFVARLAENLKELLGDVLRGGDRKVRDLRLLCAAELAELESLAESPRFIGDNRRLVHEMFEERARAHPEAVALRCGDREWTYAALNGLACRFAGHLRRAGVKPGALVPIAMDRSFELIVGILGILKAGGAYVPIDVSYPRQRIRAIFEDIGSPLLVTSSALDITAVGEFTTVISLDTIIDALPECGEECRIRVQDPGSLAYVIYTSGSTGKPKGVMCTHSSVSCTIDEWQEILRLTASDIVLHHISIGFDVSVEEIFHPLCVGASLAVASPGVHKSPIELIANAFAYRSTVIHVVPSMLKAIVELVDEAQLAHLKKYILGGEPLTPTLVAAFFGKTVASQAEIYNGYGPTEAFYTTMHRCNRQAVGIMKIPIGRPVGDTPMYVLDEQKQLMPVGVPGELYIGGAHLARGYLNNAAMTADRFLRNAWRADPAARIYKTGDIARWLPDGSLDFLGRVDHQVKIRGYRVEISEIETVLRTHPGIGDVAVVAKDNHVGDKVLIAYYILRPGGVPGADAKRLREFLQQSLPEYMVPNYFMALDAFPLSQNGKLNRALLPAPGRSGPRTVLKARTFVERKVLEIWAQLLDSKAIGTDDNFFTIGGQSLLAMRMVSKIAEVYGVNIPVHQVFKHSTVATLAKVVEGLFDESAIAHPSRLVVAVVSGKASILSHLLRYHRNVDEQDRFGRTALQIAVSKNDLGAVKALCEHGADCNLQRFDGDSALFAAHLLEDTRIFGYLAGRAQGRGGLEAALARLTS
jgi:amino acid adenylation domain-containing protein